jgi:hypothetical protein
MNFNYLKKAYISHMKTVMKNRLFPKDSELEKNERFRNYHSGQCCFILGSGHSIMNQDITKLKGEIIITQNHFHAHPDTFAVIPTYHVVVPHYQHNKFNDSWYEWFDSMEKGLPPQTIFFHGLNSRPLIHDKFFLNRCYYIQTGLNPIFMKRAEVDITKAIMNIPTVLTQCLNISLFMGFKKIYLLGFDLDQMCHMHNRDRVRFYGNSPVTANDAERSAEKKSASTGIGWFMRWVMWRQFILLREYAERNKMEIINLSPTGLLDCYKRDEYEKIIG